MVFPGVRHYPPPMSRRRVLVADHVSKVLGGAEVNLLELLAHTPVRERWDVTVACSPDSPLDRALAERGIARTAYGFAPSLNELRIVGRGFNPLAKLKALRELGRASERLGEILREVKPDVVLTPTNKDHFAAGAAAKPLGIPSVWWINDLLTADFFGWAVRKAFASKARRLATRLAPVSNLGRDALIREGAPQARITTIHNGIPLERYVRSAARPLRAELGISEDTPLAGVVGRITPWKGQDLLVRIAAEWKTRGRAGLFVIIGRAFNEDAPYEAEVRRLIAEAGLESRVRFIPFRADIAEALSSLDVLLHTSLKPEPFGRVIIEAMAVGVPVIAAKAGGVPEIITHGTDGLLAEPGNAREYADRLAALLDSPGETGRLAANALRTVKTRFSIERVFQDFDGIFQSLRP